MSQFPEHLKQYIQYVKNTGQAKTGLKVEHFDEDWEPIGYNVRQQLLNHNLITIKDGRIYLDGTDQY